ncbi:MAG: rhomboid family intramembrane serine protease [Flavobacteriaceae bacterium]|nr:rhomboid family intramembrane serine protease [Flavobacteriaceae bacterium]
MDKHFRFTNALLALPLFFVLLLWFVYWLEIRFDYDFVENGIYPRTLNGLQGVLFSPFIHSDLEHLYNNSIPLLILLAALQFFYPKQTMGVLGFGILLSGSITWLIGRSSFHIGASGLIYVLFSFIFFKGLLTKYFRLIALSLTVIMIYGGMVWYVFPKVDEAISWEGHLGGFITGCILAVMYKTEEYKKVYKYDWEHPNYDATHDRFMQRFDDHGNFVNLPVEDEDEVAYFSSDTSVNYEYIENKKTN